MSGLDYTKKTELSNGVEGIKATILSTSLSRGRPDQRLTLSQRLAIFWYKLSFLRRTRGEKWLLYLCILTNIAGLGVTMLTIRGINTPVPIEIICPED